MWINELESVIERENINLGEFRELLQRLLGHGIVCRDENQTEQQLYDRFLRIESPVKQYFELLGINLHHDRTFEYVRLYPPGSLVPGEQETATTGTISHGGLKRNLRQQEVALVLVLRALYEQALREGQLDDDGYAAESLESISIAMRNLINRQLPSTLTERTLLFRQVRRLRLIRFHPDIDLEDSDAWIRIHPMIVSFVGDKALDQVCQTIEASDNDADSSGNDTLATEDTQDA